MYSIRVFNSINDDALKYYWEKIYSEGDYYPQSSYEWCWIWWKSFGNKHRTPHIIALQQNSSIIAIGPFMIERNFMISQLKFIGSGLTDFHEILVADRCIKADPVASIVDYLCQKRGIDLINFEQVPHHGTLCNCLKNSSRFRQRVMIECPVINLKSFTWDNYLLQIGRNLRQDWKKKYKKLERLGNVQFLLLATKEKKQEYISTLVDLHIRRWSSVGNVSKLDHQYTKKFFIDTALQMDEVQIYLLLLDDKIISYHFGFVKDDIFYDWNTSFDPELVHLSVGKLLIGLILKDLLEKGFKQFNWMRGNYDYKRKWMTDKETVINYQFLLPLSPFLGSAACKYYLNWKWMLKQHLAWVLEKSCVQRLQKAMRR